MQPHIFGVHAIPNGGIDMALRRAASGGFEALQIFTAIPKFYGDNTGISDRRVKEFTDAVEQTGFDRRNVMAHGAYVLNTANADEERRARAWGGLAKELERSTILGLGLVCFHPGSAGSGPVDRALRWAGQAITAALEAVPDTGTRLLVENTAGAGRTIGRTPGEIAAILAEVPKALRGRTGYGLDTCHLFASGYDVSDSQETFTAILDDFENTIGEPPSFFHLNDSEGALGSNRDRHVLLGEGEIGTAPFGWLLADPRSHGVPLVLETPQAHNDIGRDDPSCDPWDVRMLELLRELAS